MRRTSLFAVAIGLCCASSLSLAADLGPQQALGKAIFFDEALSQNNNQSLRHLPWPGRGLDRATL